VTLTLTLVDLESYHRECLIDLNKYHYLVCSCIVDIRMYSPPPGWTFLPGLLGHLSGDDLKIQS